MELTPRFKAAKNVTQMYKCVSKTKPKLFKIISWSKCFMDKKEYSLQLCELYRTLNEKKKSKVWQSLVNFSIQRHYLDVKLRDVDKRFLGKEILRSFLGLNFSQFILQSHAFIQKVMWPKCIARCQNATILDFRKTYCMYER